MIVDIDSHMYERGDMWRAYCDPSDRDLALSIVEDELGYSWLVLGDQRIHLAEVHHPGQVDQMGAYRARLREGKPPLVPYDEELPEYYYDPATRRDLLDELGQDRAFIYPNYGLHWERPLSDNLPATKANLGAWNRWAAIIQSVGEGRLHGVGQLNLQDPDWLEIQLSALRTAGVTVAMVPPALINGKRLSDPSQDRIWAMFEDYGIGIIFHTAAFPFPFHDAWYEGDIDYVNPVLTSVFLNTAPSLCLADLALNGVFERHPQLRIGIVELSAVWLPHFLGTLDGAYNFHRRFNGRPNVPLTLKPSDYIRRHVRVGIFVHEKPAKLIQRTGDMFMYGSDFPHAEGLVRPVLDYVPAAGQLDDSAAAALYSENADWLLGRVA
jgi:predicted TIM-barrel fold metal-dependent hydrolase